MGSVEQVHERPIEFLNLTSDGRGEGVSAVETEPVDQVQDEGSLPIPVDQVSESDLSSGWGVGEVAAPVADHGQKIAEGRPRLGPDHAGERPPPSPGQL